MWPCIICFAGYLIYEIGWQGDLLSSAPYTNLLIYFFPLVFVICIMPSDKEVILKNITHMFAVLMLISLIVYAASLLTELPSFGVLEFSKTNTEVYSPCKNYLFLTIPVENLHANHHSFLRFQGPFIEPGHVGMMCAFLLFSNKFDFKNRDNIIITIVLLFTFSLAGYMLALIGYILVLYSSNRINIKTIITLSIVVLGIFIFGNVYNNGDNFISESILKRLQYDEERGFSGNNRSGIAVLYYFANLFDNIKTALFGFDAVVLKQLEGEAGTGLVWFLVHHGIMGFLFVLWFYFIVVNRSLDKKYAFMYLLFLFAVFFQRNYPFWFSWIICFDYGIQINDYTKVYALKNKRIPIERANGDELNTITR